MSSPTTIGACPSATASPARWRRRSSSSATAGRCWSCATCCPAPGASRTCSRRCSGIAPNILSARLKLMEEHALVSRRLYSEHPPRAEYELTAKGQELGVIVGALAAWGSRHVLQAVEPGARGLRAPREARLLLPGLRRARARRRGAARARAPHREGRVGLIPGAASPALPAGLGRVPVDRIIVAAARAGRMPAVTRDSRLRRSPTRRHGLVSIGRGRDERRRRFGVACLGLFVLTSGAMENDISPEARSELTPTATLRVSLNHGNLLPPAP